MLDHVLPLDAFVRAVGINRGSRHAFFLGAGASITSGVPSAQACIWEWKRDIFLTNNPGLESQFGELSLAGPNVPVNKVKECKEANDTSSRQDNIRQPCCPYPALCDGCTPIGNSGSSPKIAACQ